MYTIISIEGIDRIGKSTFIQKLKNQLEFHNCLGPVSIEKPTIGINTLHKDAYPLQNVPGIMEIRNIGLFEELLFQVQQFMQSAGINEIPKKCVIRDRFHLSELAYGMVLRPEQFNVKLGTNSGYDLYSEWTRWFEKQLMETWCNIKQITFVLDESSYPNEDEAISSKNLIPVNKNFIDEHEKCTFPKKIIKLHMKDGKTDIMEHLDEVVAFVLDYDTYDFPTPYVCTRNGALYVTTKEIKSKVENIQKSPFGLICNEFWTADINSFVFWYNKVIENHKNEHNPNTESEYWFITHRMYQHAWHTIPVFVMLHSKCVLHIESAIVTLGSYNPTTNVVKFGNGKKYYLHEVSKLCTQHHQNLIELYNDVLKSKPIKDASGFADKVVGDALRKYVYDHI